MSKRKIAVRGHSILECPVCKKTFKRPNSHIRGSTNCCSRMCSGKVKPKKFKQIFEYECLECKNIFIARLGRGGTYEYCSIPCMAKARGRKLSGSNHPFWKGGSSERTHESKKVISRIKKERGQCEKCGNTKRLQGHHKIPWKGNQQLRCDPANIQILCADCHALVHPKLKKFILSH